MEALVRIIRLTSSSWVSIQVRGGQAVSYLVCNWPGKTEIKRGLSAATVEKKTQDNKEQRGLEKYLCLFRYSDKYRDCPLDMRKLLGFFPPALDRSVQFLSCCCGLTPAGN